MGRLSSSSPESLYFGSHCSVNIQPTLDCFILNFKLKYEDSENMKADHVNSVVLTYIKSDRGTFLGRPGR